ncbi:MAG: SGNH/GDSL hydrolase family protein [Rikenellaceae bacterium]
MRTKFAFFLLAAFALSLFSASAQRVESISILGDSYSTFEGCVTPEDNLIWYFKEFDKSKTDVSSADQTWWGRLTSKAEYRLECNNSYSGSTICNTGYNAKDVSESSFIARMDNLGDPDIILIFGATNDSWAKVPIGEFVDEEWSREELFAFRPALSYMFSSLGQIYADANIYFILNDNLREVVASSVIDVCNTYNVECIQLRDIDKISGHPSIKGMEQIYSQVEEFLKLSRSKVQ